MRGMSRLSPTVMHYPISKNPRSKRHDKKTADIFIACVNGLKGFAEAIEAVFPKTQMPLSIVHMGC